MKDKALKIVNLILALFLAIFSISYVFAWFADGTKVPLNLNGQASAYFAYGTCEYAQHAFGITEAVHLYNLSWLQNSGMIEEDTYFELGDDIDMNDLGEDFWIAPIGGYQFSNDVSNAFNSIFDGKGHTILNLRVTTNKNLLRANDPAHNSNYKFSNAVGFFGKTGESAEIKNFILNNPRVEVEAGDGMYCDTTEAGTDGQATVVDTKVVGFAVGEDNATSQDRTTHIGVSNIGVIGGILSVQRSDYQTKNAIIGSTYLKGEEGETISGNTGYFDPTVMYSAFSNNSNIINNGKFVGQKFIVSDETNTLSLGAFSFATQRQGNTEVNIEKDYQKYINFSTYQVSTDSKANTPTYINYLYNGTALTKDTSNFSEYEEEIKNVNSYVVPAGGWTEDRPSGTFEYPLYTGGASQDEGTKFDIYTEAGVNANTEVTLSNARTIKMDINKMESGNPSVLILVTANSDAVLTFAEYSVTDEDGNEVKYSDYTKINKDEIKEEGDLYTFNVGGGNNKLTIIYQELKNKAASYGLTFNRSVRLYFMRVVGVSGQDSDGEGNLDNIDFIPVGLTMNETGELSPAWDGTGTLIQILGTGASIIIGFEIKSSVSGEGDSATTTYTFSVTYSAVASTDTSLVTYSFRSTVANKETMNSNGSLD